MTGISQSLSNCVFVLQRGNDRVFGENNCVFVLGLAKTHFLLRLLIFPAGSALSIEYISSVFMARVLIASPSEIKLRNALSSQILS